MKMTESNNKLVANLKSKIKSQDNAKLCNNCGKFLKTLYKHKCVIMKIKKPVMCGECGKTFKKYGTLWSHKMYNHHPRKDKFCCNVCEKSFNSASVLREHSLTKHRNGIMPHVCKICKKDFPTTTKIKRHMMIHNVQRAFQCNECSASFSQKVKLRLHMTKIHDTSVLTTNK